MSRRRTRLPLEWAIRLRISDIRVKAGESRAQALTWGPSNAPLLDVAAVVETGTFDGKMTLHYYRSGKALTCVIGVKATRPRFGGLRWWMICPRTGKLAMNLYLFPDHQYFCHRTAIDPPPSYLSQRLTPLRRAMARAADAERNRALAQKLIGERGGVSPRRYAKLVARAIQLRAKETALLVERLYSTSKY